MACDVDSTANRLVAVVLYAPIGLGASVVEAAPAVVDRLRQRIRLARFVGELTVREGTRRAQQLLDPPVGDARDVEHQQPT